MDEAARLRPIGSPVDAGLVAPLLPRIIPALAGTTATSARTPPPRTNHPRWRDRCRVWRISSHAYGGDHKADPALWLSPAGPSRRWRGPRRVRLRVHRRRRTTPAGGDHMVVDNDPTSPTEPPPRWRGPPTSRLLAPGKRRTTPALAGTKLGCQRKHRRCVVHPRIGGVRERAEGERTTPPRAGTTGSTTRPAVEPQNTPRQRGGPPDDPGRRHWRERIPRAGGDHSVLRPLERRLIGPPPCRRGPSVPRSHPHRRLRPPPRAGGDHVHIESLPAWAPDPRAGGDHRATSSWTMPQFEPPPRLRGPLERRPFPRTPLRTTPALAGTTSRTRRPATAGLDHSRTGGDHARHSDRWTVVRGPPPRWRGARSRRALRARLQRTTPRWRGPRSPACPRSGGHRPTPALAGTRNAAAAAQAQLRITLALAGTTAR